MHKKKRPEIVTQTRREAANEDHVRRERWSDRLLTVLVILTLVLGIAAMSVDYLWNVLARDSAEVSAP